MNTQDHIESLTIEDPHTSGYCALPKYHLSIDAINLLSNRVGFKISGLSSEIQRALSDLSSNTPVGSKDLIESIKRMRHLMFKTKSGVQR